MIGWMEEYKTRLTAFKATTKVCSYLIISRTVQKMNLWEMLMKHLKTIRSCMTSNSDNNIKGSILRVNENCLSYIDELWTSII